MARTLNGNLTGAAARTDRADRLEKLLNAQLAEQLRANVSALDAAIDECIALEGAKSFWAWWDSDAVPGLTTYAKHIRMVRERIADLRRQVKLSVMDTLTEAEQARLDLALASAQEADNGNVSMADFLLASADRIQPDGNVSREPQTVQEAVATAYGEDPRTEEERGLDDDWRDLMIDTHESVRP